jgi:hypothetical protein
VGSFERDALERFFPPPATTPLDEAAVSALLAAAQEPPVVELPSGVLHPALRPNVAELLDLTEEQVADIVHHVLALRSGEVLTEDEFLDRFGTDELFGDWTGADALARADARVARLLVTSVPVETELGAIGQGAPLGPEPSLVAFRVFELWDRAERVRVFVSLAVPEVLIIVARLGMQLALERLCEARRGHQPWIEWAPFEALVPHGDAPWWSRRPAMPFMFDVGPRDAYHVPRSAYLYEGFFVVQYPTLTVVVASSGEVLDAFPARCQRLARAGSESLLLTSEPPQHSVRDVARRRWHTDEAPSQVPLLVAETLPDVKQATVLDLRAGRGYGMAPYNIGADHGVTVTSANGRDAWCADAPFVLEMETGRPVLDARRINEKLFELFEDDDRGEVLSFARRADGSLRVVVRSESSGHVALWDEAGNEVASLPGAAAHALDPAGERLLSVRPEEAEIRHLTTGDGVRFDLTAIRDALPSPDFMARLGEHAGVGAAVLAVLGHPEAVGRISPAELADAVRDGCYDPPEISAEAVAAIQEACLSSPALPGRVLVGAAPRRTS